MDFYHFSLHNMFIRRCKICSFGTPMLIKQKKSRHVCKSTHPPGSILGIATFGCNQNCWDMSRSALQIWTLILLGKTVQDQSDCMETIGEQKFSSFSTDYQIEFWALTHDFSHCIII